MWWPLPSIEGYQSRWCGRKVLGGPDSSGWRRGNTYPVGGGHFALELDAVQEALTGGLSVSLLIG